MNVGRRQRSILDRLKDSRRRLFYEVGARVSARGMRAFERCYIEDGDTQHRVPPTSVFGLVRRGYLRAVDDIPQMNCLRLETRRVEIKQVER